MLGQPYKLILFEWLLSPQSEPMLILPDDGDVSWRDYPIPPSMGSGGFEILNLALGMSIFRAEHRFNATENGDLIRFANVIAEFKCPVFQIQSTRGGRIEHSEQYPEANLRYTPNSTLFRYTDRFELTPVFEGGSNIEMVCLTMAEETLVSLIGEEYADTLRRQLGVERISQVIVRDTPVSSSILLHEAIPHAFQGPISKLIAQAKCLEYLSSLITHFCSSPQRSDSHSRARKRSHEIRNLLIASIGKPPSLAALATQHGRSAKLLNEEFQQEFGKPIHSYILDYRLNQAHAAIENSDIPLKTMAAALGYSHISNFTNAFKKKFGYPPGKLRNN